MKNLLALIALSCSLLPGHANPTDHGCCTAGGSFLGIVPQIHKNYVGVRFSERSYRMPAMYMDHGYGPMLHHPASADRYTSVELWGRFYPVPRLQVLTVLPYAINRTATGSQTQQVSGLGDLSVTASYALIATPDSNNCGIKHRLQTGAGVKLPTGRHTRPADGAELPANFQPGTGTIDFLATAVYTVRIKKIGLNTDIVYRRNTENRDHYRFGTQYNGSCQLFYWQNFGPVAVLPSAGLYYERAAADWHQNREAIGTGGHTTFSTCGLDVYYKRFALGGTWQRPLQRQPESQGMISNDRKMVNLTFMF